MHGDGGRTARWDYPSSWVAEDGALREARAAAAELGCSSITPEAGAVLRFVATALRARAVVEVGTGTGVSGLWLLRGMAAEGVLTSIDAEPEHQRVARATLLGEGFPAGRIRLINGMALDVLPRLADAAYDLVLVDTVAAEYPRYLDEAVRLLRPGGVVALVGVPGPGGEPGAGADGRPDPDGRARRAQREVRRIAFEDDRLVALPLPGRDDLLLVAKAL